MYLNHFYNFNIMNGKFLSSLFIVSIVLTVAVIAAGGGGGTIIRPPTEPEPEPLPDGLTDEEVSTLKCSTLKTINERVSCRINLERENELYYLPEECRALDGDDREKCKDFYNSVQTCWTGSNAENPVACARNQLGLSSDIAGQIASCTDDACVNDVTDKVHSLVKFRLYNLEWKAEYLVDEGVDINHELLVDVVANLELKKQQYNEAATT